MILAFLMIPMLQKELDTFKDTIWNTHRIRGQKETVLPDGIPNHIHSFPDKYNLEECGMLQKYRPEYFTKRSFLVTCRFRAGKMTEPKTGFRQFLKSPGLIYRSITNKLSISIYSYTRSQYT